MFNAINSVWALHREALWRLCGRWPVAGPEKHGTGHLDGPELPRSPVQHRPHPVCALAEPLQQLPDDVEGTL